MRSVWIEADGDLANLDRQLQHVVQRVEQETHGHQVQASEILGLNRATLRHKLRALGLTVDKILSPHPDRSDPDQK